MDDKIVVRTVEQVALLVNQHARLLAALKKSLPRCCDCHAGECGDCQEAETLIREIEGT